MYRPTVFLISTLLVGCVSYNEFTNHTDADSASIKITRKPGDNYQTSIAIVSQSELKLKKINGLSCYDETKDYWRYAESLGHWWDKPDIFETTLTVSPEKQYLLVKNWVLGLSCGGVFEFTPEKRGSYILEITGLIPNCLMSLKPKEFFEQGPFFVNNVPKCK